MAFKHRHQQLKRIPDEQYQDILKSALDSVLALSEQQMSTRYINDNGEVITLSVKRKPKPQSITP